MQHYEAPFKHAMLAAVSILLTVSASEILYTPPAFAFLGQTMFGSFKPLVPMGIQYNSSLSAWVNQGWIVCLQQTYNTATTAAAINAACTGQWVILACRSTGSDTLLTAAAAQTSYLLGLSNSTGAFSPPTHNGTAFYYAPTKSIGFAAAGSSVNLNTADQGGSGSDRLSWHIDNGGYGGYRCGGTTALNDSTAFEKIVLTY